MPRIPTYEADQIATTALQTPRAQNLPAGSFAGAIGKGLLDVGVVANKMQDEADTLRAEEAYNEWMRQRDEMAYGKDGAFMVKGANVFNRPDGQSFVGEFTGKASTAAGSIAQSLANDNQRAKFSQLTGRAIRSFGTSLSQHEAQQGQEWRKSVYEGVVNTEADNLGKNFDNPEERLASIDRVKSNTRAYAQNQGLSGEALETTVKEATGKMHGVVIGRLLESGRATDAKSYYEANQDAIPQKDAEKIRKLIKADTDSQEAQEAVDNVIKAFGPQDDEDSFNLDEMAAQIRDSYKDKPDVQAKALTMLKERASERDYSIKQRDYQTKGGIWKQVINGGRISDIQNSPEFKRLDGTTQASLLKSIEAYQKDDGESSLDKYADYWAVASNPQALSKMSDAQIFAMAPKIGTSLVKQLLKDKVALGKTETKVFDVTVDNDMMKSLASAGGVDINSKDGKKLLGELEYRSKLLIEAEQQNRGRKLTLEEKQKVIKRLFVEVPVRYVGTGMLNDGKVYIENKRLYQVQDAEAIIVPEEGRKQVIEELKKQGIENPTEKQIRNGYILLKAK
jgi:hypothetical protein